MDFSNIEAMTMQMVDIPSPTGQEEAIATLISTSLEAKGWVVVRQFIDNQPNRFNILATRLPLTDYGAIKVVINSHLDVVPPHIPASQDDLNIYGRGANETKGQIAVILNVADEIAREKPELAEKIALLFVVGEEIDHIGMQKANEFIEQNLRPDFLIVGEPTELNFGSIQKGALKVQLRTTGVAGHSGYASSGISAIHKIIPILNDVINYKWPSDPKLGNTTFNVGLISGGQAQNAWAESASANIFFRVTTSVADIVNKLEQLVEDRATIEVLSSNEPVILCPENPPMPLGTTQVAFNTDIAYYGRLDELKGRYLIGAGSITNAFSKDEFISKKSLKQYRLVLKELINVLLSRYT